MYQLYLRIISILSFLTFSIVLYCSSLPIQFNEVESAIDQREILDKKFKEYKVYSYDFSNLTDSLQQTNGAIDLLFIMGREHIFDINLVRSQLFGEDYHIQLQTEDGVEILRDRPKNAYNGISNNSSKNKVRLTIDRNFIYGYIHDGDDRWFIEPVRFFHGESQDLFVVYNANDAIETFDNNRCATEDLEINKKQIIRNLWQNNQNKSTARLGECYQMDYAIANDWLMYQSYNQDITELENRNIGVVNNVQGNYEGEFDDDIIFNIVTQYTSTCSTCDPWTSSNDAGSLLSSFTSWGNGGNFGVSYGNATLWTDRNFNGSTIGIAWIAGICNNNKYNVCSDFSTNAELIRVLTAHEIGHNFNATHDPSGSNTIMAPSVNSSNDWSSQSINQISSYIVTRSNISGCFDDCIPPDPPVANFFQNIETICPGTTVHFYDKSENSPTSWSWIFPGGSPSSSTEQNPVVTYSAEGSYDVTLTVSNDFGTDDITINGTVFVTEVGGYDVVLYDDFEDGLGNWTISNPDNGTTWVQSQVSYMPVGNHGAAMANHGYSNTGAKDALISDLLDFSGRLEIFLEVEYSYRRRSNNLKDSLNIYLSLDGGQTYTEKIFADTENGSGNFATAPDNSAFFNPADDEDWCIDGFFGNQCLEIDISDYTNETSVVLKIENVTGNGNNLYINRLMLYSSCEIASPPEPIFSADVTFGCAPLEVQFEDLSTQLPTSWNWSFPGGNPSQSSDQHPLVLYENEGIFDVTLEVENHIGPAVLTIPNYIEVVDLPEANFEYEVDDLTVEFTSLSVGGTSFSWDFGDGNSTFEENPTHTYAQEGQYEVVFTASNFCGNVTHSEIVVIALLPTADFEVDTAIGCASFEVQFINNSSANSDSYMWEFPGGDPNGSFEVNPTVTYDAPGFYEVTLKAFNPAGSHSITKDSLIEVMGEPVSNFSVEIDGKGISTENNSENGQTYTWDFGDGNSSEEFEPEHEYVEDGTYEILLVAESICGADSSIIEVEIITPPEAGFSVSQTEGCVLDSIQFHSESSNNVDSLYWTFEGGTPQSSNLENPSVIYQNAGQFAVQLIVINSLGADTLVMDSLIVIKDVPIINASWSTSQLEIEFVNDTEDADYFLWDFGDGNNSNESEPTHEYAIDGIYNVTLTAANECDTSLWETEIEVFSSPSGEIAVNGKQDTTFTHCSPFMVVFEDKTQSIVTERLWVFPGGIPDTATVPMVEVIYESPGTYPVQLIVVNPEGTDTVIVDHLIEILPNPTADFEYEIDNKTVEFFALLDHVTDFEWDFGDGTFSQDSNVIHEYADDGVFEVSLTVWNSCDTVVISQELVVGDFPNPGFEVVSSNQGCAPFTVEFENLSSDNVDQVEWTFEGGDPEFSTEENPVVTYTEAGEYTVSLKVSNALGSNSLTKENIIIVIPGATANYEVEEIDDGVFEFINSSEDADDYFWDFGDGNTSEETNPTHQYDEIGKYTVTLIAQNHCGADTFSTEVEFSGTSVLNLELLDFNVYPNPTSGIIYMKYSPLPADVQFRVINILGQKIVSGILPVGSHFEELDLTKYPPGSYLLLLIHEGEINSFRLQLTTY
nr:PKD domain-containing protein [Saprospiraceae bacterium]